MNYIYDIVLNFNKEYYNFFEWNKKDKILNIKKIPCFLVDDETLYNLKYSNVLVDVSFIDYINNNTITYSKNKIKNSCLVTNSKETIGVMFNDRGMLIKRSGMLIDEEEEVINEMADAKLYNIPIIKNDKAIIKEGSRSQRDKIEFLTNYINKEKNITNLKYLYYDYFEIEENNICDIKKELLKEINTNWNTKLDNLCTTVKMFNKINN